MLRAGQHAELIELLRERGALSSPDLADLVADAWLCDYEIESAMDALAGAPCFAARAASSASAAGGPGQQQVQRGDERAGQQVGPAGRLAGGDDVGGGDDVARREQGPWAIGHGGRRS